MTERSARATRTFEDALIFAAGRGTRLEPLTRALPKPAVPVAHAPLAAYALAHLAAAGASDVRLNLHHLGERLPPALEPHVPAGVRLRYSREETLLGTAGGLRAAFEPAPARGPVVIMNGDILFAPDLARAVDAHLRADAIATMVLSDGSRRASAPLGHAHPDPARLGAVEIDAGGRVRRLLGRPERVEAPLAAFMFTGVHVLAPRAFRDLPEEGCIIRTAYRAWIDRGETVLGVVDDAPFADLGTIDAYLGANVAYAEGRPLVAPPVELPAVHPGARVGRGAVVEASVVGEGAVVGEGVRVSRCVVWPGARVSEDVVDAVVTESGVVRRR